MSELPLVIVAAVAKNRVIGDGKGLPWRLPSDLAHFRRLTLGKPLIMGRRTFQSIGRALPGRHMIVVTRNAGFLAPGIRVAAALDVALAEAADIARATGAPEIIVAGGGELYAQTIAAAAELHLTEVDLSPPGEVVFPVIDPALWREVARAPQPRAARDGADFAFVDYGRRTTEPDAH